MGVHLLADNYPGQGLFARGLPSRIVCRHPFQHLAAGSIFFATALPFNQHERIVNRTAISSMQEGQHFDQSFRAADKQLRVNRQGGKYIVIRLADRSGTLAGMLWNADEDLFSSFDRGDFIRCKGRTQVHNGALQAIVSEISKLDAADVDPEDFERFDAQKSDQLVTRLKELIGGICNVHLRQLGEAYLADEALMSKLRLAPAAVSNHHAYPGGLLAHTIDLMELSCLIAPRYPQLDGELLMVGAFLHDLGKMEELAFDGELTYTDRGQMIGHIVIGIQMLGEKIARLDGEPFPEELRLHLEHLVVSHHGQLEFGSPRLPLTLEALALHHIDNLDAKMAAFTNIIETDVAADGNWTNYTPSIGRKLWKKRD